MNSVFIYVVYPILDGKYDEAEKLSMDLVKLIGKSTAPFDVSLFNEGIHQEVVLQAFPDLLYKAHEVAELQHIYQHNQTNLEFIRVRALAACSTHGREEETLVKIKMEIETMEWSSKELTKKIQSAIEDMLASKQYQSRKFQMLSNASKARHDILMATIQNIR